MTALKPDMRQIEREANQFAMELLMPTAFLLKDLRRGVDIESADDIHKLAKKYGVSDALMAIRIGQLIERASDEGTK